MKRALIHYSFTKYDSVIIEKEGGGKVYENRLTHGEDYAEVAYSPVKGKSSQVAAILAFYETIHTAQVEGIPVAFYTPKSITLLIEDKTIVSNNLTKKVAPKNVILPVADSYKVEHKQLQDLDTDDETKPIMTEVEVNNVIDKEVEVTAPIPAKEADVVIPIHIPTEEFYPTEINVQKDLGFHVASFTEETGEAYAKSKGIEETMDTKEFNEGTHYMVCCKEILVVVDKEAFPDVIRIISGE